MAVAYSHTTPADLTDAVTNQANAPVESVRRSKNSSSPKLIVVLPSYNASKTLRATLEEIPMHLVDDLVLVDDGSNDATPALARELGIRNIIVHDRNKGYGANQKTCFDNALALQADIIILLHPDYQYSPKLIGALYEMISSGIYDVVLASRILGGKALQGGMPLYKYISNRALTFMQNLLLREKISEYHTGYRAYTRSVLENIRYHDNSDGFIFDNEILSQILMKGYRIGEISCPAKYFPEASSIRLRASITYGLGILRVIVQHLLFKAGIKIKRYR